MTTAASRTVKNSCLFHLRISQMYLCSRYLSLSELTQDKCVMPALNSKLKYENLAVAVRVLENTQNLLISLCCFHIVVLQSTAKKCTKFIMHVHSYCSTS